MRLDSNDKNPVGDELTLANTKQCTALPPITASVFINDDEYGLHQDYEKWLEGLAPQAPIGQSWHNDTGEDACPSRQDRLPMPT